jgi:large subunit ribosomal protein L9
MQVILLRDVAKIGKRFEVCEVPSGHALNYLIPRKLAEPATKEALRKLSVEQKKKEVNTDRHDEHFKAALTTLAHTPIVLTARANEQGHLFKAIHADDISAACSRLGLDVKVDEVVLSNQIKTTGNHAITFRSGRASGEGTLTIVKA